MSILSLLFLAQVIMDSERILITFAADRSEPAWLVVNDDVMGGRSSGTFERVSGRLRFSGALNTRGGGFASVRTEPWPFDCAGLRGFRIRLRGDGRRYRLRLGTAGSRVGYLADFLTASGLWQEIDLLLTDFQPSFRGRQLDLPDIDPGTIESIGFMIADQRDGPFVLDVDWIKGIVRGSDHGVDDP